MEQAVVINILLVHSPLVGPTTWRWVAEALSTAGHETVVPDLRAAAASGHPGAVISSAAAAVPRAWAGAVIVGHSGAGAVIPSIAAELGDRATRLVFVDAGVPPCEGHVTPSTDFLEWLRTLAVGGRLPRWSGWWAADVMELLVPVRQRRIEIEVEMEELPLAYFESAVDVPSGWCDTACSFLLLSEAYRADADDARRRGWPTIERFGNHLDIVNDGESIATRIIELAG